MAKWESDLPRRYIFLKKSDPLLLSRKPKRENGEPLLSTISGGNTADPVNRGEGKGKEEEDHSKKSSEEELLIWQQKKRGKGLKIDRT